MKIVEDKLKQWSESLEIFDLNKTVQIIDEDGSVFVYRHATAALYKPGYGKGREETTWLLVASEHNGDTYYSTDDLLGYHVYQPCTDKISYLED